MYSLSSLILTRASHSLLTYETNKVIAWLIQNWFGLNIFRTVIHPKIKLTTSKTAITDTGIGHCHKPCCILEQYTYVHQMSSHLSTDLQYFRHLNNKYSHLNPSDSKGNYSATSDNTKLEHWPLMGGLLHLVQRGRAWAGCGCAQSPLCCIKCNSSPINGQCTNHCIAIWWSAALWF